MELFTTVILQWCSKLVRLTSKSNTCGKGHLNKLLLNMLQGGQSVVTNITPNKLSYQGTELK